MLTLSAQTSEYRLKKNLRKRISSHSDEQSERI